MDDLISRQAAIDAAIEAVDSWDGVCNIGRQKRIENYINKLPPANCSEIPNSSDTISRKAAIDALRAMQTYKLFAGDDMLLIDQAGAQTELMMLPPAQPEPCEDVVSRHRLLSDLKELIVAWEKYPVMAEQIKGVEAAIGYVELIPSAQPETQEERTETHACDLIDGGYHYV